MGQKTVPSHHVIGQLSCNSFNFQKNNMQNYEILCHLGTGCSANVYLLRNRVNGELVAGKKILLSESRGPENTKRNIVDMVKKEVGSISFCYIQESILKALAHPNIIPCYDCFTEDCSFYIILEYMEGGDLSFLINHFRKRGEYT